MADPFATAAEINMMERISFLENEGRKKDRRIAALEAVREWLIERRDEQSQPDYIDEYEKRIATIESAIADLREIEAAKEKKKEDNASSPS